MNDVEKIIKYKFKNRSLLVQALVHSSCTSELCENYERLEFLGDRVLGVGIAYLLYKNFPNDPEGSLSQRHVALVNKETVADVARQLGLSCYIKIANEEIRDNDNVLCDVCEAVIGAIYLDGGNDAALEFVEKNWRSYLVKNLTPPKDAKTSLQELAHIKGFGAPIYEIVKKEGSEHEPRFHVKVNVGKKSAIGFGKSKKIAEQEAAGLMISQITDGK